MPLINSIKLQKMVHVTVYFFCLVYTLSAYSSNKVTQENNKLPIHIKAESFQLDEKKGLAIYQGKVLMTQGNIEITADKIELHRGESSDQFFAYGHPAFFQQQNLVTKEKVEAEAGSFQYSSGNKQLHLRTEARLVKKNALFEGDYIHYDTLTETVKAEGKDNGVMMILPPTKQTKK